jgi:hypothetical protein
MKNKNTNKDSDDRYFRTTTFNTAAYLYAKGYQLAGINKTVDSKRSEFVFVNSADLQTDIEIFLLANETEPDLLISARTLFTAIKQLKNVMYQGDMS